MLLTARFPAVTMPSAEVMGFAHPAGCPVDSRLALLDPLMRSKQATLPSAIFCRTRHPEAHERPPGVKGSFIIVRRNKNSFPDKIVGVSHILKYGGSHFDPAIGFTSDLKYHLHPIPFTIKTMTLPSLFAGKMHALLCRSVRTNIKGRDWYDLIWFVKNNIPCELYYLKNKMVQTGHFELSEVLDKEKIVELLSEKIKEIDFSLAKRDVEPFLKDSRQKDELNLWSDAFFNDYLIQEIDFQASH